ncbi:MAG: thioredoxin domain-containing protein [Candidatus Bathyarchaeota archaeon]|nr:thioredoxin domain-containing protein [Candidatus Bathyarchaeota archaeon]
MSTTPKPNRLIHQKSPYLQQHAYNPVDWYPWSQEALDKAKAEDKPIFLSIGYSTCHWCHVMEQECFNDQQVADLLNNAFVCIKVDREERPDLDATYMAVCQAMGRRCGWPLHIIMTPSLNPFLAASYIPKQSRPGVIGMIDLIPHISQTWKNQRAQLETVGADIKSRFSVQEKREPEQLGSQIMQDTFDRLKLDFDPDNGGFGSAPKFPTPHKLLFLLRYYRQTGEQKALEMAEKTLRLMRLGGIFDQVGLGFHRYSTDEQWLVPHFEKMLYDQALLALAYVEAYQATGAGKFMITAKEVLDYCLRDMQDEQGGFYSAQDADSEGEEGKYYLWTTQEIQNVLSEEDFALASELFWLKPEGNYLERGSWTGKNILHMPMPLEGIAQNNNLTLEQLILRMGKILNQIYDVRKKRIPPATDTKVLTDWNGLMIAALAKTASVLNQPKYVEAAKKTADYILTQMHKGNMLYHRSVEGEVSIEGFLDDYAFFIFGLIELYEATFEEKYLKAADELSKEMMSKFWDQKTGGFFQTTETQTGMPKIKQLYDGAIPSGNSVALHDLLWLSRLLNEPLYDSLANQMMQTFARELETAPEAYTYFIANLPFLIGKSYSVVVVGDIKAADTQEMLKQLRTHYLPDIVIQLKTPNIDYQQVEGKATAYVCQNQTCLPATNSIAVMLELLGIKDIKP